MVVGKTSMTNFFQPSGIDDTANIGDTTKLSGRYAGLMMMASPNLKPDNMMNGNVNHHATNHLDSFSLTAANEEAKKKQDEGFSVEDQKRRDDILTRMNTMRKEGNLCDAILDVKGQNLSVHRVVLASSCTFFYEMFSLSESRNKRVDTKEPFVLEGMDFESVERIVNYFYTSKLSCDYKDVSMLYKTAMKLKVNSLAEKCSKYLVQCLTPQNCLGTYEFVSCLEGKDCMREVGRYIQENIFIIMENSTEFSSLPCIVVDIMGQVSPDFNLTEQPLCRLVVSWLLEQNIDKTSDEQLRFFLFLNPDNKLIDCSEELPDRKLNNSNIVKDYKKKCSKKPSLKDKRNSLQHQRQNSSSGTKSPQPPLHQSEDEDDVSTSMVASAVVADKSFICLAVLDQRLVSVSIKFQSDENVRKMSSGDDDNTTDEVIMTVDRNQPQCLMTHLSSMSTARCGFGVGVANGNIIAVGGYDRGECFNTAEIYSPITNLWSPIKPMSTLRGRFSASMLNGKLYACGGSNGTNELNSIEAYDVASDTWINVPDMAIRRSGAGVAVCGNKLFVVGGLCGSKTLSSCEMYDPAANKWTNVANLNTGRSQAAVCSYGETSIVALGGCDAWNFMNTCECYDPLTDTWSFLPSLVVARRGAGAAYFKGMLFVVGGSNEQTTLTSVEIFDPDNNCWFAGPSLGIPRSIMGVTVLEGNRLFVIGGFSGKNFLKSLECLSYDSDEFCSYLPAGSDIESIMRADSIRKFKFQNCMSSRSSHTSSTYSDSPKSPQLDDVANTVTRNINSDSEISSSCSLEDLNKDYHFNHHSTTTSAFGDSKMVNGTAAAAAASLAGDASLSNGGGCVETSGNHVDL